MSPEVVERAVEPFFTTKREGKGTGLGLAMASGFVQQSRGRLEIESEQGKGALIRMLFPVSASGEDEVADPHPAARAQPSTNGGRERILVVEDSAEVLEVAVENLTGAGYAVTTAESGEAALTLFRNAGPGSFDLLFTDLVMPGGINGLMLAKEVSSLDPAIGVLMTTGYNEELVVSGPERPQHDVLGKPYRRADLLDRVRQALNNRAHDKTRRHPSDYGAAEA
jgi:CheY-like chemotaxis protein